jgi:hypothetical protein
MKMSIDLWSLYALMLKSRLFEESITQFWKDGLISGEIAAVVLEANIPFKYARVCTQTTIPYARRMENNILPNTERIRAAIIDLLKPTRSSTN